MKRIVLAGLGVIGLAATAFAADRFPQQPLDQMSPLGKELAEKMMSGPRKGIIGPFNTWLRSPEQAQGWLGVSDYIRYKTTIPPRLNEFAIIVIAREATAQYEWYAHHPLAIKGGLKPEIAEAVRLGKRPTGMAEDEALVYDFTIALQRNHGRVPDALFDKVRKTFGEQGIADLIGVNGFYSAVSMTLNVAQVPMPEGEPDPLPALK